MAAALPGPQKRGDLYVDLGIGNPSQQQRTAKTVFLSVEIMKRSEKMQGGIFKSAQGWLAYRRSIPVGKNGVLWRNLPSVFPEQKSNPRVTHTYTRADFTAIRLTTCDSSLYSQGAASKHCTKIPLSPEAPGIPVGPGSPTSPFMPGKPGTPGKPGRPVSP